MTAATALNKGRSFQACTGEIGGVSHWASWRADVPWRRAASAPLYGTQPADNEPTPVLYPSTAAFGIDCSNPSCLRMGNRHCPFLACISCCPGCKRPGHDKLRALATSSPRRDSPDSHRTSSTSSSRTTVSLKKNLAPAVKKEGPVPQLRLKSPIRLTSLKRSPRNSSSGAKVVFWISAFLEPVKWTLPSNTSFRPLTHEKVLRELSLLAGTDVQYFQRDLWLWLDVESTDSFYLDKDAILLLRAGDNVPHDSDGKEICLKYEGLVQILDKHPQEAFVGWPDRDEAREEHWAGKTRGRRALAATDARSISDSRKVTTVAHDEDDIFPPSSQVRTYGRGGRVQDIFGAGSSPLKRKRSPFDQCVPRLRKKKLIPQDVEVIDLTE